MISRLTFEEIQDKQKEIFGDAWETAFDNLTTENNELVSGYFDGDEFYTDGEHYVKVDDLDEYIDGRKAWQWAIAEDEWQDVYDSLKATLEKAVRLCCGVEFTTDNIAECYKEKAKENADLFLEWLWEQKNDED